MTSNRQGEASRPSETSVLYRNTTRCDNPEDSDVNPHHRKNLNFKSCERHFRFLSCLTHALQRSIYTTETSALFHVFELRFLAVFHLCASPSPRVFPCLCLPPAPTFCGLISFALRLPGDEIYNVLLSETVYTEQKGSHNPSHVSRRRR